MSEPTEFHAKCPPSYEELVRRLEVLEQQVAQMQDRLLPERVSPKPAEPIGWIPNPAYENAEYEYDPASGAFWKRKP